jgi:hypothetical protein
MIRVYLKCLKFAETHYAVGELFMEYIKNGCEEKGEKCNFCNEHSWVGEPATDKYNAEHFLPFEKNAIVGRKWCTQNT